MESSSESSDAFEYLFSEDPIQNIPFQQKTINLSLKNLEDLEKSSIKDLEESEPEWEDFDLRNIFIILDSLTEMNFEKEHFETIIEKEIAKNSKTKRRGITKNDRKFRLEIHKLHLLCLISHASLRNCFSRDKRIHAKLKLILPNEIQQLFNPNKHISDYRKSKMFMSALRASVSIWKRRFKKNKYGLSKSLWITSGQVNKENIEKSYDNIFCFEDFLKAAEQLQGSRDLGAQLFLALLDSNNVNTRLVTLLQPLSYGFGKSNSLNSSVLNISDEDNNALKLNSNINKNVFKHSNNLNPSESFIQTESIRETKCPRIDDLSTNDCFSNDKNNIRESFHPVYWVEALNPFTQKWIFVDPMVSYLVGKPSKIEQLVSKSRNSLSYIISFDKNGHIKDVTRRYTKNFNSKVKKQRIDSDDEGKVWWERILNFYKSDYISQPFDIIENEEFLKRQACEKIPKSLKGLKNHPLYVIERHLKREQVISSKKPCSFIVVRKNGNQAKEPIFYRKDIVTVLSANKWYQYGRKIKFGEQPMKIVPKYKEFTFQNNSENAIKHETIGLYSESQTELYIPPPVVDGKVPKNTYGNLDIFVSSMIPKGAVYLPFPGISKVAKILDIDYSDTVIGFKFKKNFSLPIIKGITIAEEFEEAVCLAYKIMQEERNEEIFQKTKDKILTRWRRFYKKLCICERLKKYDMKDV
ncbi:hypothetical protein PORY_001425 [Pneumocystis oryctolagi]|uniref:Uncharacterized protein n=1 Tax=Pneumocystis oryctolagi TaxID=42067 RepID=A0ACB7CCN3_9ASCO|nr:hypothetical protein PORY_001425 [Pneumocystis oryctolagi]